MRQQLFACISDQGTAMAETLMTADEYANDSLRADIEKIALSAGDCTRIQWEDVTKNDAFWGYGQ